LPFSFPAFKQKTDEKEISACFYFFQSKVPPAVKNQKSIRWKVFHRKMPDK
jgi:hypothetical protein